MLRFFGQVLLLLVPVGAFAWWAKGPVQHYMYHGAVTKGILLMLAGLAFLALVEGVLLKLWLLPRWAYILSERFSSGSYLPEDDPLVQLVQRIAREQERSLLPELTRMVESDPRRVRGWLELARVQAEVFRDAPEAVAKLLQGARAVRNKEDAALLMWRAATLCEQKAELADRSQEILAELARKFPATSYGQLASERVKA